MSFDLKRGQRHKEAWKRHFKSLPKLRNPESGIRNLRSEILKPRITSQQTKKRIPLERIFFCENLTFKINGRPRRVFAPFGSKNLRSNIKILHPPTKTQKRRFLVKRPLEMSIIKTKDLIRILIMKKSNNKQRRYPCALPSV